MFAKSGSHWVSKNVIAMGFVIDGTLNAMVRKSCLPYLAVESEFFLDPVRKAAFDELNGFFERKLITGRDDRVQVVSHDDEFMQQEAAFVAVIPQDINEKLAVSIYLEQTPSSPTTRRNEKGAECLWT